MLRALGLLPSGRVRLPLVGPPPAEAAGIHRELQEYEGLPGFRTGLVRFGQPDTHGGALRWPDVALAA